MDGKETDTMRQCLYIVFLFFFIFHLSLCRAEHLFEMGVHGGVAGWSSQTVYINPQAGPHGGAQLYYNYLSPRVIGFRTGLTLDWHQPAFVKKNYEDHYTTIDVENQRMEIDYTIGNLSERYNVWLVGVPLQLAFAKNNFLFLLGAKATIPLSATWHQTVEQASLSVYYPDYDNRVYESYPLAASRDFVMSQNGKLQLPKIQWWLSAELSYVIPLNNWARNHHSYILVGVYLDYCLTKYTPVYSAAESMIMLTDTRDGFPLQRVLTPVMEANRQDRHLVTRCTLFDAGIKISYALAPYNASRRQSYPCHCINKW